MKKFFAYVAVALMIVMTATNCSKKDEVTYDDLKLSVAGQNLAVREGENISFDIKAGSGEYEVLSSNNAVIKPSLSQTKVVLTGVAEGEATVTVLDKKTNQRATVKIAVSEGLVDLALDVNELTLYLGENKVANISSGNGDYEVSVSDSTIATATLSQTTVVVGGVSSGTTTVKVKDKASSKEVTFNVIVTEKQIIGLNIEGNDLIVRAFTDIERDQAAVKGEKLENTKIQITSGAGNYTVTSSDETIAKVKVEGDMVHIDGYKTGVVTITISNEVNEPRVITANVYALSLEVSNISLKVNESVEVQVIDGSGQYELLDNLPNDVNATIRENKIIITGLATTKADIILKDKVSGKEAVLGVYVVENIIKPEEMDTVLVEGGSFLMGSDDGDPDERVRNTVTLSSYRISKYEVTNAQFAKFLNEKGNKVEQGMFYYYGADKERERGIVKNGNTYEVVKGRENYPVTYVSWYGANAYAEWVGGKLPTEAQWEFASLGGVKSNKFKFSGSNIVNEVGYHLGNSKGLNPVGTLKANELGIHDMSGNAWEWTADEYYSNYTPDDKVNPEPYKTDNTKKRFVRRGASVYCKPNYCRSANRGANDAYQNNIGFRVVFKAE
ncbi:SUMF1/EgtB/PvdO family nonheme iron enzyme [Capnocytophaga stomatis]|uniref:SUMF1/EgtB/PvdO family nonheme iron enzyme n=1 Tax=Capnocytophaga stomatis TaxID=1848904 RepID=UPI00385F83A4